MDLWPLVAIGLVVVAILLVVDRLGGRRPDRRGVGDGGDALVAGALIAGTWTDERDPELGAGWDGGSDGPGGADGGGGDGGGGD